MIVLNHSYPQQWIQYGAPKSFWISGFFYPQGNQYLALYETYISTDACYSPFQKANGRYFSVLLLIMLYMVAAILQKMVLTFKSGCNKCDHSNEIFCAVRSCSAVYYAVHGGSNFWICG